MATTVFAQLDTMMLTPLTSVIDASVSGLTEYVAAPLKAAAIIYIALYGLSILRGAISEPFGEYLSRCIKIALVIALATSSAEYNYYIKNVFFDYLPSEIGSAMNKGPVSANQFDSLLSKTLLLGLKVWKSSSWGFKMIVDGLLIFLIIGAGILVSLIGYVVFFYAKVALALVLSIGPIFVALALFDATRQFTQAWLNQAVNYVILQVLVVALGSVIVNALISYVGNVTSVADVIDVAASIAAICLASGYIFFQLPYIASALAAGGAALTYGRMPGPKPKNPGGNPNSERGGSEPGTRGRQPG